MNPIWTPVDYATSLFLRSPALGMLVLFSLGIIPMAIMMFTKSERRRQICWYLGIAGTSFAVAIAWFYMGLINPTIVGGSYIQEVDDICVDQTTLIGTDTLTIPDPDGDTGATFRIHGFNLATHQRTFRHLFTDHIELLGIVDGIAWIATEENTWYGIDIVHGAIRYTVNARTIKKARPELSIGIHELRVHLDTRTVHVLAKDGHTSILDLVTLEPSSNATSYRVACAAPLSSTHTLTPGVRAQLRTTNGHIIDPERTFLNAEIIASDAKSNTTLIRSFTTTDHTEPILTAIINDTVAWEKTSTALEARSPISLPNPPLTHAWIQGNEIITLIGGTVIGLDRQTGQRLWNAMW